MKMVLNSIRLRRRVQLLAALAATLELAGCGPLPPRDDRPSAPAPAVWVEREAFLMGTYFRVRLAAPSREAGLQATESVGREIARLEDVLSSWRSDSEIGRVNSAPPGQAVPLSPELWHLLDESRRWSRSTGAAFDFAVGALVDAWDLRGNGHRPDPARLARARAASGADRFRWDAAARTVARLDEAAWLDTGGFGKGAALRAAARVLQGADVSSAVLDFGGQVLFFGAAPEGGAGWELGVAHPSDRARPVMELRVPGGSVATSSQSERFVDVAGQRFGHILDPRTGHPVPDWGSVTVVAQDPMRADVLSTALFVLGPRDGMRLARQLDDVGVLFLEYREGEVVPSWNSAFERYVIEPDRNPRQEP